MRTIAVLVGLALVALPMSAPAQIPDGWSANVWVCRGVVAVAERQPIAQDIESISKRGACIGMFGMLMFAGTNSERLEIIRK